MTGKPFLDPREFDSPDAPGSGLQMDRQLVTDLDAIRDELGPLTIQSGVRTAAHNSTLVNAVPDSAHLRGFAVDVSAPTSSTRLALVKAAIARGYRRIGIGKGFVHLDRDPSLPQDVLWLYPAR